MTSSTNNKKGKRSAKRIVGIVVSAVLAVALVAVVVAANTVLPKFNQIINSNLASIDPGFGQFALAKASADLMKKVLNK